MDARKVKTYYKESVKRNRSSDKEDLLNQVGKTYLGKPINNSQLGLTFNSIKENLNLNKEDVVIDLGCGNGLLSNKIAHFVKYVYGFDFTPDMINVALRCKKEKNVNYIKKDILKIDFSKYKANKITMYEVLQYFDVTMFRELLNKLNSSYESFELFVAGIPDARKIFYFYNTKERRKYYYFEVLEKGNLHIGNWWYKEQIRILCKEFGLSVSIIKQNKKIHTAHYRFDVLIEKKK